MAKRGAKKKSNGVSAPDCAGVSRQEDRIYQEALDQGRAIFSKDLG